MAPKKDFAISFADLPHLFLRHKKRFLVCFLFFTSLGLYWGLTSRPNFEGKGIFRESQKSGPSLPGGEMKSVFLMASGGKQTSDVIALMKSRSIMEEAIKETRLQAIVVPIQRFPSLHTAKNQIAAFLSRLFYGSPTKLEEEEFLIEADTDYAGEKAVAIDLEFSDDATFTWKDLTSGKEGHGKIGDKNTELGFSWTLFKTGQEPLPKEKVRLLVQPLQNVVKALQGAVFFESSVDSNSFTFVHARLPNRKKAAAIVNAIMDAHVNYLVRENKRLAKEQIAYLSQRESDLGAEMAGILEEHAKKISKQFIDTGFSNSEQLMTFLGKTEETYKSQLLKTELDLRLLKELGKSSGGNPALGKELDTLGQQKDMLTLAFKKAGNIDTQQHLGQLLKELGEMRDLLQETKNLSAALQNDEPLPTTPLLDNYQGAGVATWKAKIQESGNGDSLKVPFQRYLDQLARFFNIEEKTLAAKMSHRQDLSDEFGSLDLEGATTLIRRFTEELQTLESSIAEKEFYIKEVALNDSQLTALTSSSSDPTLQLISKKAAEIVLAQYDIDNRSAREQERLEQQLGLQRTFLKNHLNQTKKVMGLKKSLIQEKIRYLQKLALGLIEQRMAVLQRRSEDQSRSQLRGLESERDLLEDYQKKLRLPASEIADNWVREKGLDQKLMLHRRMIEEVSRLVESQNITTKLETLQSSPLDRAVAPLSPRFFPFILFPIAGGLVGAFLGSFAVLGASLVQGVEATTENLRLNGQKVAGIFRKTPVSFPHLKNEELDPLRVGAYLLEAKDHRRFVVSLPEKSDIPLYLSQIFAERGKKVLLIDLAAVFPTPANVTNFWEWLKEGLPVPETSRPFTCLSTDENPPFASEIVFSDLFKTRLEELDKVFDYIVVAAPRHSLKDPLFYALLKEIPDGLVVLSKESLESVQTLQSETPASLCFLFTI